MAAPPILFFSFKETATFVQFLAKSIPASLSRIPAARLAANSVNSDGNRSYLVVVPSMLMHVAFRISPSATSPSLETISVNLLGTHIRKPERK
jgi:hypothetical protein